MSASQDFRDGAATGAALVAARLHTLESWGVETDSRDVSRIAAAVGNEYGGRPYTQTSSVVEE